MFEVLEMHLAFFIHVNDIKYGENATIVATVTSGATGNVTFTIDNKTKTATITNGVAKWDVTGLATGNYTVFATYEGNENYKPSNNNASFKVNKADSSVVVSVNNIKVGDDAVIVATVISDATGNVTFTMGAKTETIAIEDGEAKWIVSNLAADGYIQLLIMVIISI